MDEQKGNKLMFCVAMWMDTSLYKHKKQQSSTITNISFQYLGEARTKSKKENNRQIKTKYVCLFRLSERSISLLFSEYIISLFSLFHSYACIHM